MTKTVTFTEFRNNLINYLDFIYKQGGKVTVTDGRNKKILARLLSDKDKDVDWVKYMKKVNKLGGSGLFIADENDRKKLRADFDKKLSYKVSK